MSVIQCEFWGAGDSPMRKQFSVEGHVKNVSVASTPFLEDIRKFGIVETDFIRKANAVTFIGSPFKAGRFVAVPR